MPTLENWKIIIYGTELEKMRLNGTVFGHISPRCYDGMFINTSHIISAKDEGETLAVQTKNTLYTLRKEDMSLQATPEIIGKFAEKFLPESAEELAELAERKHREFLENGNALEPNTLYLELSSQRENYFSAALYRDRNGELHVEVAREHIGTFQDSVILEHSGVRWFPKSGGVEFYRSVNQLSESEEQVCGYIRNVGTEPISVTYSWGDTDVIKSGELRNIFPLKS